MTNVKCNRCGVVNVLADEICRACGLELSSASPISTPAYGEPPTIYIRPFNGIGDVLAPAFNLCTKNAWLITKLTVVIVTPFEIFKALSVRELASNWQMNVGTLALQAFCNVLIAPALIYALMKVMQTGIAPGINESYRWGLNKLAKLSICAVMALALELIGLAFCVIPGIFLFLAFELVYPMAVLEEGSPTEILNRSYTQTKGFRWNILGATFVMTLILSLASAPATIAASLFYVNGVSFWPLQALAAIIADIVSQGSTVLSLVIYLSILRTLESRQSLIE